jgi:hypothetical protein
VRSADDAGLLAFEDCLAQLLGFVMISAVAQSGTLRMHLLVQLAMRHWLACNSTLIEWKQRAICLLAERFPVTTNTKMAACKQLFPHADSVMAYEVGNRESQL